MNPIYGCSTDMGSILSSGQGEAAAATVVAAAASFVSDEPRRGVERVDVDAYVKSDMRGLVTAGP